MTNLQLGTRVRFSRFLGRTTRYDPPDGGTAYREWETIPSIEREGIICGVRTLADGKYQPGVRESGIWNENYLVDPKLVDVTYRKAYLVAFNIRQKPVYVLPEDLEVIQPITFNHVGKPLTEQEKEDLRKWFHSKQEA